MPAKRTSSRRAFLAGKSAIDAISEILPDAELGEPAAASAPTDTASSYLVQIGRDAMACEFQVLLNAGQHVGATETALEALDLVEALEEQLSWFRESSELTRINRTANAGPVIVEARLFDLLAEAVSLSEQTGGAFDITASPLWKLWGFHRREGRQPTADAIAGALEDVGTRWLKLESEDQTIQFLRTGVEVTLGAIGKGYALDRCAEVLRENDVSDFLIHGGQSSMLAHGSRSGTDEASRGWTVALRHPLRHDQRLAEISLRDRALGTSGSGNQFFHFGGKRYGHVLDPRTGWPAEGVLSATALAPKATQADALATAFFVMGVEESLEFCDRHPEIGVLFVCPGEETGSSEIRTRGLAEDDWQCLV